MSEIRKIKSFLSISIIGLMMISVMAVDSNATTKIKPLASEESDEKADSILWKMTQGIPGTVPIFDPISVKFTEGGDNFFLIGTDGGLGIIDEDGVIRTTYLTFGPVITCQLINDIDSDGEKDIVLVSYDKTHANLIAISSQSGEALWKFNPTIMGFNSETLLQQEYTTYSWDLEVIDDINGDGKEDVVVSSWYRLFAIDGDDGSQIWKSEPCSDDIWQIEEMESGNLVIAGEDGNVILIDPSNGNKMWEYLVPQREIFVYDMFYQPTTDFFNVSIANIQIISDVSGDSVQDILVGSDDGYLRVIDGQSGVMISDILIYEIELPETPQRNDFTGQVYTAEQRFFSKYGMNINPIPDINENSVDDYAVFAYGLELQDSSQQNMGGQTQEYGDLQGFFIEIHPNDIQIVQAINWSMGDIGRMSNMKLYQFEDEYRLYFFNSISFTAEEAFYPGVYYTVLLEADTPGDEVINTYTHNEISSSSSAYKSFFTIIDDISGDAKADFISISGTGKIMAFDPINSELIWVKSKSSGTSELQMIGDISGDGITDYLFLTKIPFLPEWPRESMPWGDYNNDGTYRGQTIINQLTAISGIDGEILWNFVPPSNYDGILTLLNIGDMGNDQIDDFAGLIMPSIIPDSVKDYFEMMTGSRAKPSMNEWEQYQFYRALLLNYTRIVAFNGSSGQIFANKQLPIHPYRFNRYTTHSGTYLDPISPWTMGNEAQIYPRVNGKADLSWYEGDWELSAPNYNNAWDPISLLNVQEIETQYGLNNQGNHFDLWNTQNELYSIEKTNDSASTIQGLSFNSTSIGTIKENDNLLWVLNSTSNAIETYVEFTQPNSLQNEIDSVSLEYKGYLSSEVSSITIYSWNFTANAGSGDWVKISNPAINSTSTSTSSTLTLTDSEDFCDSLNENQTRFKLTATSTNAFTLNIDKFLVKYLYKHLNYTIESIETGLNEYQTVMNLTFNLDFSDEEKLGLMDYPLSQIDRLASIKFQAQLLTNLTGSYQGHYEMYNYSSNQWVTLDWNPAFNYWNSAENTFTDLYGNWNGDIGSGYARTNWNTLDLSQSYRTDTMYVTTRGISGGRGEDNYVSIDLENQTTLSHFINRSSNTMKIKLNVTQTEPFKLTLDSLGIRPFYWGLYQMRYDENYLYDYNPNVDTDTYGDGRFVNWKLRDVKVQDLEVINGTGDEYLDVIAVVGSGQMDNPCYSTNLRLFDFHNDETYTKWSKNLTYIPANNPSIVVFNESSTEGWMLCGLFQDTDMEYRLMYRSIEDIHWELTQSIFENYTQANAIVEYNPISFTMQVDNPNDPNAAIKPAAIPIDKNGRLGIIMGDYSTGTNNANNPNQLSVVDPNTFSVICQLTVGTIMNRDWNNVWLDQYDLSNYQNPGNFLSLAVDDFNNDGFLDHIAMYSGAGPEQAILRIFSGNDLSGNPIYEEELKGGTNQMQDLNQYPTSKPWASIGDSNDDGAAELAYGMEVRMWDINSVDKKGSTVFIRDIASGTKSEWLLEPFETTWGETQEWESRNFYRYFKAIGDLNNDNANEVLASHFLFSMQDGSYGRQVTPEFVSEILDIKNQKIISRFSSIVSSIQVIDDLNGDGYNEYILNCGEAIYCVNSEFRVEFSNIKNGDFLDSNAFTLEWSTASKYDYFELRVDGVSYGPTQNTSVDLSLGGGERTLEILMYDESGLIIALEKITITVPTNTQMLLYTLIGIVGLIGLTVVYKAIKKRGSNQILIEDAPKEAKKNE